MDSELPFILDTNDPLSQWRAESFWTKEEETLAWLKLFSQNEFNSAEVLVDVGANIGVYSLYWLSLRTSSKCISCEPLPANYNLLKKNIALNGFGNRVKIITNPIYSIITKGKFDVADYRPGSSGSQFKPILKGQPDNPLVSQALKLDEIVKDKNQTHILKIDIDGLDYEVLKGGTEFLSSKSLLSILIESSEEIQIQIKNFLALYGFVEDDRFNHLEGHSDIRRKGKKQQEVNRVYTLPSAL